MIQGLSAGGQWRGNAGIDAGGQWRGNAGIDVKPSYVYAIGGE
jgi:hypothetical protein